MCGRAGVHTQAYTETPDGLRPFPLGLGGQGRTGKTPYEPIMMCSGDS